MINLQRKKVFFGEYHSNLVLAYMDERLRELTEKDLKLVDCSTCFDPECMYKNKAERFPPDAGGKGQCLRWAQNQDSVCWRSATGEVMTIPNEVIETIAERVLSFLEARGGDNDDVCESK